MTPNPKPLFVAVASVIGYMQERPHGSVAFYYEHGLLPFAAQALSLVRRGLKPQLPSRTYVIVSP